MGKIFDLLFVMSQKHLIAVGTLNFCINLENTCLTGSRYLSDRHQRVGVNGYFSNWNTVKAGVSQDSIFGLFSVCVVYK